MWDAQSLLESRCSYIYNYTRNTSIFHSRSSSFISQGEDSSWCSIKKASSHITILIFDHPSIHLRAFLSHSSLSSPRPQGHCLGVIDLLLYFPIRSTSRSEKSQGRQWLGDVKGTQEQHHNGHQQTISRGTAAADALLQFGDVVVKLIYSSEKGKNNQRQLITTHNKEIHIYISAYSYNLKELFVNEYYLS